MYKAVVRALVRRSIAQLNQGDAGPVLAMAAPGVELIFPGDNSWAAMHRPVVKGRNPHVTHQGLDEVRAFAQRFVEEGIQFKIEDILVNGPPWRTRVAARVQDFAEGPDSDCYNNRAVAMIDIRWGRIVRWEDYEDTERVAAWDLARAGRA